MKIGMLSSDWGDYEKASPGGCTWIRFFGPGSELNRIGVETVIGEMGWWMKRDLLPCQLEQD